MLLWALGLIGTIFGIVALYYIARIVSITHASTKESMIFLFITGLVYIGYSTATIVFGVLNIEITSIVWVTVPILFVIAAITWTISTSTFLRMLKGIVKGEPHA